MIGEIKSYALSIIWLVSLFLPYLLFIIGNEFQSLIKTAVRAIIAISLSWAYFVSYATISNDINNPIECSGFQNGLVRGSDSTLSFSVVFGWVLPTIIVGIAWVIHFFVLPKFFVPHKTEP